jgi:hypothetical protein
MKKIAIINQCLTRYIVLLASTAAGFPANKAVVIKNN